MKNENNRLQFKRGIAIAVTFLILCTPSISLGWGPGGHMMTASIAFNRLNPGAKAKVQALLAIEIDPVDLRVKSPDFINASHWADDLRDLSRFDFLKPFHFVDWPFTNDGTSLPSDVPEADNILKALNDKVNILKTSTDQNEQARALRLIIHFVGDIHQPLHCATRVSKDLPKGDQGGNKVMLKVLQPNGSLKDVNLHSYWDGGIGTFPKPVLISQGPPLIFDPPPLSAIGPAAAKAKKGNPATAPKLRLDKPFDFESWSKESFDLAKSVAYPGMENGVTPNAKYNSKAVKTARKRVAWGGYRLAALLNAIWP